MSNKPIIVMPDERVNALFRASLDKPNEGRIWNYFAGGDAHYAVDREFADRQIARLPSFPWAARKGAQFVFQAVRHMALTGITQIVDLGAGLPTESSSHNVLELFTDDACHVVYVDHDPMAAAHTYLTLEERGKADTHKVIQADIENHVELWDTILSTGVIDPSKPIGLLAASVWHFVADDKPLRSMQFYRDAVVPGSQLALSHANPEGLSKETKEALEASVGDTADITSQAYLRSRADILTFFGDWDLLEPPQRQPEPDAPVETVPAGFPGLDWIPNWTSPLDKRPAPRGSIDPSRAFSVGGLAVKP